MLGSCDITVTSDPIAPSDLSVQVVSGLDMSITGSPAHPWVVTTTVTAFNILHSPDQVSDLSLEPGETLYDETRTLGVPKVT